MTPEPPEFKIVKLPRNGPKPGQSTESWLHGKDKHEKKRRRQDEWKAMRGK